MDALSASRYRPMSLTARARSSGSRSRWLLSAGAGVIVSFAVMNLVVGGLLWHDTGYRNGPVFGDVLRPGFLVRGTEGYCITSINSLGLRGPELSSVQRNTRVLFLGDSFTQAFQVFDQQTFVDCTERLLAAHGVHTECVNAGVSGENSARYIGLSAAYRKAIQPSYVVVQLSDHAFSPDVLRPVAGGATWWLKADGSEWIPTRLRSTPTSGETLRKFATFVPLVVYLKDRWQLASSEDDSIPARAGPPVNAALIDWSVTQLARDYGPNMTVLWIPSLSYTGGSNSPTLIEIEVARACSRRGIQFVDPRDEMQAEFRRTGQPLQGFGNTQPGVGHLNAEGHRIVADVLAEHLLPRLSRLVIARMEP